MFCVRIVLLRDREQEDEFYKVAVSPIDAVRDHSYRDNRLECHQRHRMRDGQDIIEIGLAKFFPFQDAFQKVFWSILVLYKLSNHAIQQFGLCRRMLQIVKMIPIE